MKHIKQIIRLYESKTLSIRDIVRAKNLAKSTVEDYINRYKKSTLNKEDLEILSDNEIYQAYLARKKSSPKNQRLTFLTFIKSLNELA